MWYKKKLSKDLSGTELDKLQAWIGFSHSDMSLVGQYENAVDILINTIVEKGERVDMIAHPLLYLMRHSIELALKENIKHMAKYSQLGPEKLYIHSISSLFEKFEKHYTKIATDLGFKQELSNEYDKYAIQLRALISKLGNDMSSFRYVSSKKGKIFDHTETLDLYEIKEDYDNSMVFLTYTADIISPYTDFVDYCEVDSTIKDDAIGYVSKCLPKTEKRIMVKHLNKDYNIQIENELWYDDEADHHLILKEANEKCYLIPIKCDSDPKKS